MILPAVAVELRTLVAPGHTVLVTQECQNGIIGADASLRELSEAAAPMRTVAGELTAAARAAGITVVHCVAWRRPDGKASSTTARMFAGALKAGLQLTPGSYVADVIPEIGVEEGDIVLGRYHGLGPMGGTDLDMVLRNLGATTIVGVGVSVNVGMLSFGLDAVNHGYQFVLPRDAVAGLPADYAEAVIDNSFAVFGTVVRAADVMAVWKQ
ncbi:MAG: yecD [Acidimicrobiales bacterium]|nr:yecD [Acidimicrobiales bacterium]